MSIKQLNGSYLTNDDRVVFRFNTIDDNEYKFLLTRRITHFLLSTMRQLLDRNSHAHMPNSVAENQSPNTSVAYEAGSHFPIGLEPILVVDAKCDVKEVDNHREFLLDFVLPGGGTINLKLPVQTSEGLMLLLEQLNTQAKWGDPNHFTFAEFSQNVSSNKMH